LTKSSNSLVDNTNLVTKIYFPRVSIPLANVISGLVDFGIASIVLIGLLIYYQIRPTILIFLTPIFLLLAMLTSLGFGLWLSALNVRYRDVKHLLPFIIQIWLYLTPVIYEATLIPAEFRWILALNPMTLVVSGFRYCILGTTGNEINFIQPLTLVSLFIIFLVLFLGGWYFRRTERTFADEI
jgi:lipopolysaccharide transport system permease protein